MGMNMKEFVTLKKHNEALSHASEMRKYRQMEILEKNQERQQKYLSKRNVISKEDR